MTSNETKIGLLGAGEMGAALAGQFVAAGIETLSVSKGRSDETLSRIDEVGITSVPDMQTLIECCDLIISVLPPEVAESEATEFTKIVGEIGRKTIFVEANAISPDRTKRIANTFKKTHAIFVDGGIVGGPPSDGYRPRLYVSGPQVRLLDELDGCGFNLSYLGAEIGQASAFKMLYAAMTKGSNTLLTAGYLAAEQHQLLEAFLAELGTSQPALYQRAEANIARLPADAARWVFEMREIASTFRSVGLPGGFHEGAAEIMALLATSEFGIETRRTRDKTRSSTETIQKIARQL